MLLHSFHQIGVACCQSTTLWIVGEKKLEVVLIAVKSYPFFSIDIFPGFIYAHLPPIHLYSCEL